MKDVCYICRRELGLEFGAMDTEEGEELFCLECFDLAFPGLSNPAVWN